MGVIADGAAYILGKGMIAEGTGNGAMRRVGNVTDFTTNVEFETLEIFSNETATKTLDKEFKIATNPGFAFTMQESAISQNMALGLSGTITGTVTQTSATDEVITAGLETTKGCFIDLGKRNITSITFTTPVAPTVTTDYVLFGKQGMLFIPYTSTIADETEIAGTITYGACTYKTVSMFSADTVEREIWFISAIEPYPVLKIWRASIKPAGDLPWISDEPLLIPIEGKILDDSANHASPNHFGTLIINEV